MEILSLEAKAQVKIRTCLLGNQINPYLQLGKLSWKLQTTKSNKFRKSHLETEHGQESSGNLITLSTRGTDESYFKDFKLLEDGEECF